MQNKALRKLNILDRYGNTFPLILADMKRYNNRIKIKNESIAEHSFFVAYNIIKIGYDYDIPENIINKAVSIAITHDIPEMYTSDLPHDCKSAYPELRHLLSKIEGAFVQTIVPEIKKYYDILEQHDTIESLLVDLGDAISVLEFSNREIELGNKSEDFQVIHNEICVRVTNLFEKLESILKASNKGGDKQ